MELSREGGEGVTACPDCGEPRPLAVLYHDGVRLVCPRCGLFGPLAPTILEAGAEWDRMVSHLRAVVP